MTTLTVPAEQPEVLGLALERGSHCISFEAHGATQVTVTRRGGTAAVALTTDGTAPSTPGSWRFTLPAGTTPATAVSPVPVVGVAVVRLHVEGPVVLDVRSF